MFPWHSTVVAPAGRQERWDPAASATSSSTVDQSKSSAERIFDNAYRAMVDAGKLRSDAKQELALVHLQQLYDELLASKSRPPKKGWARAAPAPASPQPRRAAGALCSSAASAAAVGGATGTSSVGSSCRMRR